MLATFIALTFLMGGGSRADITSLLVLRPLALLCGGYAVIMMRPGDLRRCFWPMIFLAAGVLLCALQLVPLPPGLWHSLPGRDFIARQDLLFGQSTLWRPISMSPSKTWNSLIALCVPIAGALLYAVCGRGAHRLIVLVLVGAGLLSALLGLAQISGPPSGPLYLYAITNEASAVGLFANRNHQSFYLAAVLPLAVWLSLYPRGDVVIQRGWLAGAASLALLFLIVVVSTGSRTGLVLYALSLVASAGLLLAQSFSAGNRAPRAGRRAVPAWKRLSGRSKVIGLVLGLVMMVGAAFAIQSTPAYQRMSEQNIARDARVDAFPIATRLIRETFPFGTGLGSFEFVYQTREPDGSLGPTYLNQAHDDWLQIVFEAGLVGVLLVAWALAAWVWAGVRTIRAWSLRPQAASLSACALFGIAVLALASLTDYPLRLPSMMVTAVLLALLARSELDPVAKGQSSLGDGVEQ